MHSFNYQRAKTFEDATVKFNVPVKFLAGGTTLIDLMKLEVEAPQVVMDINHLPWIDIKEDKDGWKVGALVKNSDLAYHKDIRKEFKVLSDAILSGASAQLRNKATTGGNLLQRTRCVYFRDPTKSCNKREPGSGCAAIDGHNRNLAILGTSDHCIATNPSDMNVAMTALEAKVHLQKGETERSVEIKDFHVLPGKTPHIETTLQEDELITGVTIPKLPSGTKSLYVKLRDRASYEFALSSIAVVITMKGERIDRIRLAMGGIGTKPWRVEAAEKMLEGSVPSKEKFQAAADEFLKGAKGYSENSFKLELARRCFIKGLEKATERNA
jgi:xanthine dehydrogenase YagS FAD-binding subunit